jgi:hypothetical protein
MQKADLIGVLLKQQKTGDCQRVTLTVTCF